MKQFFISIVLMFSLCTIVYGTDYYVSATGNDGANGLSEGTAWQSISKVNTASSSFVDGDRILFKRGDTFKGTINLKASGTSAKPITIGAYGTGERPVITGFTQVSSWVSDGGGIYSKVLTSDSQVQIVTMDGVSVPMGHYPNTGYLDYEDGSSTEITDNTLPSSPSWTGAEAVIRKINWVLDRNTITSHSGHTLSFDERPGTWVSGSYGYFLQNDVKCLDDLGDWCFRGGKLSMYFGANNPETYQINATTTDNLLVISGRNYITVRDLIFQGANYDAVKVENSSNHATIKNCDIHFNGHEAISVSVNSNNFTADSNDINHSGHSAIVLYHEPTNCIITNNTIQNTAAILGTNYTWGGVGIDITGSGHLIQYNRIINTAYDGMNVQGGNTKIDKNLIDTFCMHWDDGGGVYCAGIWPGIEITNNIILNGIGNNQSTSVYNQLQAEGIYLDQPSTNILLDGNTIANCVHDGIKLHEAQYNTITNNTSYNNNYQLEFTGSGEQPDYPINFNIINNNIFFARTSDQFVLSYLTSSGNADEGVHPGTSNNNYFARPIDDPGNKSFSLYQEGTDTWPGTPYSLASWRSISGQDANSKQSPITVSNVSKIRLEYNDTKSDKVVVLGAGYMDVKGIKYPGVITLAPFTSSVLMVDPSPEDVLVYVNSVVENVAPGILNLNFNLALANIIPAVTAFDVKVNSASVVVNSVSISGNVVKLSLANPVVYGDVVTVDYVKPGSNPLQTGTGGTVDNFSGSVENNVLQVSVLGFQNASVESAAPSLIILTYDQNLANIVPAASAFTVMVNSVQRTVSLVSISGATVRLTLQSPIIHGDVVTISYNKPVSNKLQSLSGAEAPNLSAQAVVNNVVSGIEDAHSMDVKIFPNPATGNLNITLAGTSQQKLSFLRIIDSSGKSALELQILPGQKELQIPINLKKGFYLLNFESDNHGTLDSYKLIINE
jgi:uncharacterized repeat protein (TIGR02059 family)